MLNIIFTHFQKIHILKTRHCKAPFLTVFRKSLKKNYIRIKIGLNILPRIGEIPPKKTLEKNFSKAFYNPYGYCYSTVISPRYWLVDFKSPSADAIKAQPCTTAPAR